jgi:hypothetical protein
VLLSVVTAWFGIGVLYFILVDWQTEGRNVGYPLFSHYLLKKTAWYEKISGYYLKLTAFLF